MSGKQHPPSTDPARLPRRTLFLAVGLVAVVALALVTLAPDGGGTASASEPRRVTATRPDQRALAPPDLDGPGVLAGIEAMAAAVAPPVTVPPTPTTTAPPAVAPVASGTGYNDPANPAAWDRLAQCESTGNWAANTGNGYYGGIQFSLASWQGVGGSGRPDQASRETQIAMGQRLWHQGGWSQWPACSRQLGYR